MAIKKVKTRKVEVTLKASIFFGVGAVLFVIAVMILLSAVNEFRYKWNLQEGIQNYSSGRVGSVLPLLDSAADLQPAEPWAMILSATLRCDGGELSRAEENYRKLLDDGHDVEEIHVGLGVVYLKKAFQQEGEGAFPLLEKARSSFRKAGTGLPDVRVGLAHALLFESLRKDDPALLARSKEEFKNLLDELLSSSGNASRISLPSVRDLYLGLARSWFDPRTLQPESEQALLSCMAISPRWDLPKAGRLSLLAQRLLNVPMNQEELGKLEKDVNSFRREIDGKVNTNEAARTLFRKPLMLYELSLAEAHAGSGHMGKVKNAFDAVFRGKKYTNELLPYVARVSVYQRHIPDDPKDPQFVHVLMGCERGTREMLLSPLLKEKENAGWLPLLRNNLSVCALLKLGGQRKGARMSAYGKAIEDLEHALKSDEKNYWILRNLAVICHLKGDPGKAGEYLDKAEASAAAVKAGGDLAAVKKYLGR